MRYEEGMRRVLPLLSLGLILTGCPDDQANDDPEDAGPKKDATIADTGIDAGIDSGGDAGIDSGVDTGVDAGADSGADTGVDTGVDGGFPDGGFECGNGTVEPGEDCDDGDIEDDGNGCSADCLRVGTCGDGLLQSLFEACDSEACCASDCSGPATLGTTCRDAASQCDAEEVCDGVLLDCPADEIAVDGTPCDDCTAGSGFCDACLDGGCADQRYFCSDILASTPTAADGLYMVNPALTPTTGTNLATVFCDMTGGGWTMVHKKSRTAPGDPGDLWTSGATNADDLSLMDRALATRNYRSGLVDTNWTDFVEAKVEVVTGTVVARVIEFDTVGSDPLSWFAPDRHVVSSWTDLPTDPSWTNNNGRFFDIEGGSRDWYINLQWGGCPSDRGWLMITRGNFCYWEGTTQDPVEIIYSVLPTHGSAPSQTETAFGDSLIVFVR